MASLHGSSSQGAIRLITRNNVSRFYSLPNAYEEYLRLAAVPGVARVAAANYFGGMRDVNNPDSEFANFAIEAENFLAMYPEYILTEAEMKAFCETSTAASWAAHSQNNLTGGLAKQVQLTSNIYRTGKPFGFVISAIYQTDQRRYPGTNESTLFARYKYA